MGAAGEHPFENHCVSKPNRSRAREHAVAALCLLSREIDNRSLTVAAQIRLCAREIGILDSPVSKRGTSWIRARPTKTDAAMLSFPTQTRRSPGDDFRTFPACTDTHLRKFECV
jgi:hypothetical protein